MLSNLYWFRLFGLLLSGLACQLANAQNDTKQTFIAKPTAQLSANNADLVVLLNARIKFLASHDLAYSFSMPNSRIYRVHTSADYTAMINPTKVVCLSAKGGFILSRHDRNSPYRVDAAVAASEVRAGNTLLDSFLSAASFEHYGVTPYFKSPDQSVTALSIFRIGSYTSIDTTKENNNFIINYRYLTGNPDANRYETTGTVVTDSRADFVVTNHTLSIRRLRGTKLLGSVADDFSYHPPSDLIPHPVVKQWNRKLTMNGSKPQEKTCNYENYTIQRLPSEQLRLSYYGLPNELVEDEATSLPLLWGAAAAACGVGVLLTRQWRRRRTAALARPV